MILQVGVQRKFQMSHWKLTGRRRHRDELSECRPAAMLHFFAEMDSIQPFQLYIPTSRDDENDSLVTVTRQVHHVVQLARHKHTHSLTRPATGIWHLWATNASINSGV